MFKDSNFYCAISRNCDDVRRLRISRKVQEELINIFTEKSKNLINIKNKCIEFDGRYKPEKNEVLYIEDFDLPKLIKEAIMNPTSVIEMKPKDNKQRINSIFTGKRKSADSYIVAFQNFTINQIITSKVVSLLFDQNSFSKIDNFALNIKEQVDCIYMEKNLYFNSYWAARQIFDLSDYYKMATDGELECFIRREVLSCGNEDSFLENADDWIRRKVALIEDSKVLENFSVYQIKELANSHDFDLKISKDEKIIVPEEKFDLKNLLRFLDEDIFKGLFSNHTYMTNSKRRV